MMTSDQPTAPDQDPPITDGQLVGLFKAARERAGPTHLLTDATAANEAVYAALDTVLAGLAGELDEHTYYQLAHVFDALKSVARTEHAAASAIDAVAEALHHVEKAFDRWPPRPAPPPRPWYEAHPLLLDAIADLFGEAAQEHVDETWIAVGHLRNVLGLQVLFYDPEAGAQQQADAFLIEDYAKGPGGRYVTDQPAIVRTDAEGARQILFRGRVQRQPAGDTQ
jgi:hypothetical protein